MPARSGRSLAPSPQQFPTTVHTGGLSGDASSLVAVAGSSSASETASPATASSTSVAAKPPDVTPETLDVYLLFGQSNMEGLGEIAPEDREIDPRVHVLADQTCPSLGREYGEWYPAEPPLNRCEGGLGPGDYFGKTMAQQRPDDVQIGLVPAAVSGADIALFEKGAPIGRNDRDISAQFDGGYEWLLDLARRAQEAGTIRGICFHQGETNAGDPAWKHTVGEIVRDLRSDLRVGEVPFLAGELLYEEAGGSRAAHNAEIRKLPDLVPNAHVVSAAGVGGQDDLHFDAEGYRELGRRYAKTMLNALDLEEETGF